jgi:hypothetical protein
MVVRELTGGLYFGWPKGRDVKDGRERAVDTLEYYDYEIRRVMELAFKLAKLRKKKLPRLIKRMFWNHPDYGGRLRLKPAERILTWNWSMYLWILLQ